FDIDVTTEGAEAVTIEDTEGTIGVIAEKTADMIIKSGIL
ncbi:6229_t:CDS:2, partial [Diversispora eburnea]